MPAEEFRIRITRKGEIFVEIDGLPPRRIKDLASYFEETLGPIQSVESTGDGGAQQQLALEDLLGREPEEQAEEKRLRLGE
jgi:hypothetical protein